MLNKISIMKQLFFIFFSIEVFCLVLGQHRFQRPRPAISFQSFDHSTGFPETTSQTSGAIATQLTANQFTSGAVEQLLEQPQPLNNELHGSVANLPLYKQSYPGLYVKGLSRESYKYEPTRQVAHHHGPDYQIPRNIASSPEQSFATNLFSSFN